MKKVTAVAPSNLAFVKYWGKADFSLNIPSNGSISMNLSNATTTTTVEFSDALRDDDVKIQGNNNPQAIVRVKKHLDRVRALAEVSTFAYVRSENSFPTGTGIASSASGMAALTLAASEALELSLSEKDLSILARLGSGSASRSIPSGFVEWYQGKSSSESYSAQIVPPDYWSLVDIAIAVTSSEKQVRSTEGHKLAMKNRFLNTRLEGMQRKLDDVRQAILEKDFIRFGQAVETEALEMHAIALTSSFMQNETWFSGVYYWSPETLEIMIAIQQWRVQGLACYFTLDAGPTVHVLCLEDQKEEVLGAIDRLRKERNWKIIVNTPAVGAHTVDIE